MTVKGSITSKGLKKNARMASRTWLFTVVASVVVLLLALGVWQLNSRAAAPKEAPEAARILQAQSSMPFQILIPAYLPSAFAREKTEINVSQLGPSGEPMAQLAYRTARGESLFVREWVPVNPGMEILAGSKPVETKWGKGWLLTQINLVAVWVDVGPLRVSIFSSNLALVPRETLVQIANTLGPPSSTQVFTFVVKQPIKDVAPPPPVEAKTNDQGVQEMTLVVTPGGYSPLRFSVKKGVPVRLTFRQLGQVGCGNVLIFPADPQNPTALTLASEQDKQVLEFTPQQAGEFDFRCSHNMYRGILTVRE